MSLTAKDYKQKVGLTVEHGFQSLLLALGYKLRLFDYIGNESQPRSTHDIASLANYKERYVREWLGGMVIAGLVECDPSGKKFWMTSAAKEAFASDAVQGDLTTIHAFILMHTSVFDKVCDCFQAEGPRGIPYSAYKAVNETIGSVLDPDMDYILLPVLVPQVPGLQEQLERGITCLDIGCGTGAPSQQLAERFPNSQFYGLDFYAKAIQIATGVAREKNLKNAHFVVADAKEMPSDWTGKFDYITAFDCLHDLARPEQALSEIKRVLKPGGRFSVVDIYCRSNVYDNKGWYKGNCLYTTSLFYCMSVSLSTPDGAGLGATMGMEKAMEILKAAGFDHIETFAPIKEGKVLAHLRFHYLCTKGVKNGTLC